MPARKMVSVIFVATQNDQIATTPHSQMGTRFGLFRVEQEPDNEPTTLA